MEQKIVPFLIIFPMVIAGVMAVLRRGKIRRTVAIISAFGIMGMTILLVLKWIRQGCGAMRVFKPAKIMDHLILIGAVLLMCGILLICFRYKSYKKYLAGLLTVLPTAVLVFVRLFPVGKRINGIEVPLPRLVYIDRLSIVLCVITGLLGGLAIIYATGYLRRYHTGRKDQKDRSNYFMAVFFLFIGAMFGLVLSENLLWVSFFWELLGVCCFLLIGYSGKDEEVRSAFKALIMNLSGFCVLAVAVLLFVMARQRISMHELVEVAQLELAGFLSGFPAANVAVALVAVAALVLAAQLPFSFWLLGIREAPMPSKVLLQSVAIVNAGIYVLFRLAPAMGGTAMRIVIAVAGGVTFLVSAIWSLREKDIDRILTLSTISFMGLMTVCAGNATGNSIWAGILLLIFHAVSKSILLQNLETVEMTLGKRDRETLRGLFHKTPRLGVFMYIGMAGMVFPAFGILGAMITELGSGITVFGIISMIIILAGTVITLICWVRWMITISGCIPDCKRVKEVKSFTEFVSEFADVVLLVILSAGFPLLSGFFVNPLVEEMYPTYEGVVLVHELSALLVLVAIVVALPVFTILSTRKKSIG